MGDPRLTLEPTLFPTGLSLLRGGGSEWLTFQLAGVVLSEKYDADMKVMSRSLALTTYLLYVT